MFKSIGLGLTAFAALIAAPASAATAIRYGFSVSYEQSDGGYDPISGQSYYDDWFFSGPAYVTVFPSAPNYGLDASYASAGKNGLFYALDHGCGSGGGDGYSDCFTVNIAFRGLTDALPRSLDDVVGISFDDEGQGHEDGSRLQGGGPAVSVSTIDVPGDTPWQDGGYFLDLSQTGMVDSSSGALPELGTWMMAILGMGMMGFQLRRRRKTALKNVMEINGEYPAPAPSIR
jgi:hypothetical protein